MNLFDQLLAVDQLTAVRQSGEAFSELEESTPTFPPTFKVDSFFLIFFKGNFLGFSFYVRYSALLHLPPLRFLCVGRCWDRTQDSCDYGIGCQTLWPLG